MNRTKIAAIIPARNEEKTIVRAIHSIIRQNCSVDRIIVVCDNCTDGTFAAAQRLQARYPHLVVMETVHNKAKKSGALNQAIRTLDPDTKYVLVFDADTKTSKHLVSEAVKLLERNPRLGAVCARTHLTPLPKRATFIQKVLWHLQRLEYATADSKRIESLGRIQILAGSCVVYRMKALREVACHRGSNQFYDESSLIEDYEMTLILKELGWKVTIGVKMVSWTDVPLSIKVHWQQRIRWARSHVDTLRQKGWNPVTRRDILGHVTFAVILPQQLFFLGLLAYLILSGIQFTWNPLLWVFFGVIWADRLYRLKYVPNPNLTDVLIRIAFIPEEVYGLWHSVQRVWSYWLAFTSGPEDWHLT